MQRCQLVISIAGMFRLACMRHEGETSTTEEPLDTVSKAGQSYCFYHPGDLLQRWLARVRAAACMQQLFEPLCRRAPSAFTFVTVLRLLTSWADQLELCHDMSTAICSHGYRLDEVTFSSNHIHIMIIRRAQRPSEWWTCTCCQQGSASVEHEAAWAADCNVEWLLIVQQPLAGLLIERGDSQCCADHLVSEGQKTTTLHTMHGAHMRHLEGQTFFLTQDHSSLTH